MKHIRKHTVHLQRIGAGFVIVPVLMFLIVGAAVAQDTQQQPVLPDLAPREVEIRGQLQISFPSLRRQPLVGFNPPPRVPEIPPSRRPFIEDYRDAGADLSQSLLTPPDPPAVAALAGEGPLRAELEVATGRYFARRIHGIAAGRMSGGQHVDVTLDYVGSDGGANPALAADVKNASDDVSGAIGYRRELGKVRYGARLEGLISGYRLYGIDTTGTAGRIRVDPKRDGRSATESVWIASGPRSSATFRVDAGLQQTKFETDLFTTDTIQDPTTSRSEKRGWVGAEVGVPTADFTVYAAGRAEFAGVDGGGLVGSDLGSGEAALGLRFDGENVTLAAAPRIMNVSFEPDVGGSSSTERKSATYLSPEFEVRLRAGERVMFFANNRPRVAPNRLVQLFGESPYLVTEPLMQPSIMTIDAESGIALFSGPLQFKVEAALKRSPNWAFFQASPGAGASSVESGYFDVGYSDGRTITLGGEIALSLPADLQLSTSARYTDAELVDLETGIPNVASLTGEAGLSYPFAARRGLVQITGRYIGTRHADIGEEIDLNAYLDFDIYARYNINNSWGITLRLENIGPDNTEIWKNYPQSPFVFSVGLRILR